MWRRQFVGTLTGVVLLLALAVPAAPGQERPGAPGFTPEEIQAAVMSFADTWGAQISEASRNLAEQVGTPAARAHADFISLYGMAAAFDIAAGPYPGVDLLDMMVLVALTRTTWEDYWVPKVYGSAGRPMLATLRTLEADIWGFAAKLLSPAQIQALRELVREWRAANPDKKNVNFIRFSDFGALGRKPTLEEAIQPGGLLGPVKEAAEAADAIRALGERGLYVTMRMQELISRRLEMSVKEILRTPEMSQLFDDISGFRASSERYAELLEALPARVSLQTRATVDHTLAQVGAELEAAIDQVLAGVAAERQAALEQIVEEVAQERAAALAQVLGGIRLERQALVRDITHLVDRSERHAEGWTAHVFVLAGALLLIYFLLRLVYAYATRQPAATWYGRLGKGLLLVAAALPIIALGFVYVHYVAPRFSVAHDSLALPPVSREEGVAPEAVEGSARVPVVEKDAAAEAAATVEAPVVGPEPEAARDAAEEAAPDTSGPAVPVQAQAPEETTTVAQPVEPEPQREASASEPLTIDVQFSRLSAEVKSAFRAVLDDVVALLQADRALRVEIGGHTDSVGAAATNQRLSEARAQSVAQYLIERGIAPARINAVGYGSSRPAASNDTVTGRARNRRVEVTVLRQEQEGGVGAL